VCSEKTVVACRRVVQADRRCMVAVAERSSVQNPVHSRATVSSRKAGR